MSRKTDGRCPNHLSQSFMWDNNMKAYNALACGICFARLVAGRDGCESCCKTGIEAIPLSEVMRQ